MAGYWDEAKSTEGKLPHRNGDKNKEYLFYIELWTLPRKVKGYQEGNEFKACSSFMLLVCGLYQQKMYRLLKWTKMVVFSLFSVFSSTFHISQLYWLNWSTDSCGRNVTDVLFGREM